MLFVSLEKEIQTLNIVVDQKFNKEPNYVYALEFRKHLFKCLQVGKASLKQKDKS